MEKKKEMETDLWHGSLTACIQSKTAHCRDLIACFEKEKKALLQREEIRPLDRTSSLKAKLMRLKQHLIVLAEEMQDIRCQFHQEYEAVLVNLSAEKTTLYATFFTQVHSPNGGRSLLANTVGVTRSAIL